jgi:predicted dehydrogenase
VLQLGLIGAGVMGRRYVEAYSADPNGRVVAIADLDQERGGALADAFGVGGRYADVDAMIHGERLDGVIVATPDFAHREPLIVALNAGLHVLCEKPLATTVDDATAMAVAAAASDRQVMVNFGNRHRPAARRAHELIRGGDIGAVRYARMRLNEKAEKTATLAWSARTSALWFLLSHVADFVQWMVGDTVVRVYAADGRRGEEPATTTTAVLSFAGGATAVLESTWDMPSAYPRDIDLAITVHGADGVIDLDMGEQGLRMSGRGRTDSVMWDAASGGSADDWWNRSCRSFTAAIVAGQPVTPDARDGLQTVMVLAGLQHSLDTGAVVDLAAAWPDAARLLR